MAHKTIIEITYNWPAETFIQRHIKALKMQNFPVQVVARDPASFLSESASLGDLDESIPAKILPNFNHLAWPQKLISLRFLTAESIQHRELMLSDRVLLGYFERLRPDLIHFHDATLAAFLRFIPLALGIPYTVSLRGSDVQVLPLQSAAQKAEIVAALEGARRIHAVCHALKQHVVQMVGHDLPISVIYTTLPVAPLPAWSAPAQGQPIHLVASGRLMWRKGFSHLLPAMRSLLDRGVDARLTIIGAGPDLDHLLYLRNRLDLNQLVSLPGKLNYQQIQHVLGSAQAYIQSSLAEGLSNALAEAMMSGLPVFATNVDGTSEVVEDGVSGFLLPALAPQDWAETLMKVQDALLMQKVRAAAYRKAIDLFSPERHAHAFISFFEMD